MKLKNIKSELLLKVKKHKKYKSLSDEVIINEIKKHLKANPTITSIDKQLIKDIRKELHLSYASFQTKKKSKRKKYLKQLQETQKKLDEDLTKRLLSMTLSTKERLNDYKKLYKQIFKITGKPKIIVDLACGFNAVSYPFMKLNKLKYYAYDIDGDDISFLNDYFIIMKKHRLSGKALILNLKNQKKVSKIPSSDIIFMFKIIDILDRKDHKTSEKLIKILIKKTKFIITSFAIRTLTRKKMNFPKRKWFELMLERIGLRYKTIQTENEIFYVVFKD